jgi:tetratricopeptide (TPR) repeat protein
VKTIKIFTVFFILVHLVGCASTLQTESLISQPPAELGLSHTIHGLPFFPQEEFHCGPAALATVLLNRGIETDPEAIAPLIYIPGQQGSYQLELLAASRSLGGLSYVINGNLETLLTEVKANNPVLVLQNLGLNSFPQWHFAVVKGYDLESERILLNSGTIENYSVPLKTFERTWRRTDYWAFTISPSGAIPETADADKFFLALTDFEKNFDDEQVLSQFYQAALNRWPQHHNLHMAFGNYLYGQGQLENSADIFLELIRQDPFYSPGYNNLANVLFEMEQYDEALRYARAAVENANDENPAYANTLRMIQQAVE